ncbi:MAG: FAD-dependent oxidoreductase, partial [Pirellula sp.]
MISNAFLGTFSSCLFGLLIFGEVGSAQDKTNVDVVVFGATPAGVAAALGAASDGCNVLLVEPT